jgi:hypothetical protein
MADYTFLPWARRGLAARTPAVPSDRALPARVTVDVGVTLTSLPESPFTLTLHGPGDVIGLDPRVVVRTDPRPHSVDVEPNYLPLIEFDPPDLPWLFTPAASGPDDRLRPWCVLVVVDLGVVDRPQVTPAAPLPVLQVPAGLVGSELPDLAESWAWAHAQVVAPDGEDPAAALGVRPAMNVSRLLAPRRLAPGRRYAACLVPAFDAGVVRGLGGEPAADGDLAPAWPPPGGGDVRLPIYHWWEFATGAVAGDFEQLARRLQPFAVPAAGGGEPLYVGAAGPELPARDTDDPAAYLVMDGALRAWQGTTAALGDVPADVRAALRDTLDAAGDQVTTGPTATTPVLGPPLYGAWPVRQHALPDDVPGWLRELNLDPRARAAAGIGAELVRQHQEQFVQWCWEQVEEVLDANQLLSRARLSWEALRRVHARHFAALPEDRLLQLTAPLHARTRRGARTISAAISAASLPDAAADPALRRLTSPQRPVLRAALARGNPGAPPPASPRMVLVQRLATSAAGMPVNPTEFVPHGLLGIPAMATVTVDPNRDTADLTGIGMPVEVPSALVTQVRLDTEVVTADPHPRLTRRADFMSGILGERHLQEARDLRAQVGSPWYSVYDLLSPVAPARRITDQPTLRRLAVAVDHVADDEVIVGEPPPDFRALGMGTVGQALLAQTDPQVAVLARLAAMVTVGESGRLTEAASGPLVEAPSGVAVAPTYDRVLVAPRLDVPLYPYLAQLDPARFLPGVGTIPANSVTVLKTNPRFVEALLVGVNHELSRELLWRAFPTDQRGTPFRRFWDRLDGDDIDPVHTWAPATGLGGHGPGDPDGQVALLVRADLLRRYPNAVLYAWRSVGGRLAPAPRVPEDLRSPVFAGVLGSDITFVGFDLAAAELLTGDGWFFVIQEQPTEPRFGFDELVDPSADPGAPLPTLDAWSAATWEHTGTARGGYLAIAGNPLEGTDLDGVRFVDHAAHLAALTHQQPMRVAIHAGGVPELVVP